MRLIRFGAPGHENPGLLRDDGFVDLRAFFPEMPDIGEAFFRNGWLEKAGALEAPGERMEARIGCPLSRPSKIVCLGINYVDHGAEGGFKAPERPILFAKSPSALNGPCDPIILPADSGQVDWEVELAVVIGREGKRIAVEAAPGYVAGYTLMNDVSGREAQFADGQWFRGKSFDTFAPLGPCLVTPEEIRDPGNLELSSYVNGKLMQSGNTRDLVFGIPEIIAFVSQDMTLMPGDIISTGTPAGVGIFRDPPITLQPGDIVECRIEGIGSLRNPVQAAA
jgi:2-keto-4-pentenoate hydratase/2-oxohepta-3-ene-1,7-dioic acid hydratase in catechol pathway